MISFFYDVNGGKGAAAETGAPDEACPPGMRANAVRMLSATKRYLGPNVAPTRSKTDTQGKGKHGYAILYLYNSVSPKQKAWPSSNQI